MILVTGASGFVGGALVRRLKSDGHPVREVVRSPTPFVDGNRGAVVSIDATTEWADLLTGVTTVVHCAARVHQMNDGPESADDYERVNVLGTKRLAEAAVDAGVQRFVYLSSVKALGDSTQPGERFSPTSPFHPTDPYGQSKADAERQLAELSEHTGLAVVVVRPPLVYGPGARGNIERLQRLIRKKVPIPLGSVNNSRSLVGLDNLTDFLALVAVHDDAPGNTFMVTDEDSPSTATVMRTIAKAMGTRVFLVPVPMRILRLATSALRLNSYLDRLTSNCEIDSSSCREILGWKPPHSTQSSIASVVRPKLDVLRAS